MKNHQWSQEAIESVSWAVLSSVHRKLCDMGAHKPTHRLHDTWLRASKEILHRCKEMENADLVGGGG